MSRCFQAWRSSDTCTPRGVRIRPPCARAHGLWQHDDFVIGTVARLAEHKGHDLLDAITGDLKSHANWKLLWVGDGWWRRLLAPVAGEGLAARVVTTSWWRRSVPAHMRAMDVLFIKLSRGVAAAVPRGACSAACRWWRMTSTGRGGLHRRRNGAAGSALGPEPITRIDRMDVRSPAGASRHGRGRTMMRPIDFPRTG